MQAPAIDDHVTTKLYEWYTIVSRWEPSGEVFSGSCAECSESALVCAVDVTAWPHDVIHPLVVSLRGAIDDVQCSYVEERAGDAGNARARARLAVVGTVAPHTSDILDVLEQCLSERLRPSHARQVELGPS